MGLDRLLDSVILIDHFNGISQATDYLRAGRGYLAISVVTRAEVLAGFDPTKAGPALLVLNAFPSLMIDPPIADLAAHLKREHKWKLPDAFQAAIAHHHRLRLVTRNIKDFPPNQFDFVDVPYTL